MYEAFYGLKERPFSILPDPEFLFWAVPHSFAYTMLDFGLMSQAPITVITGEVGAGKTTLVRHLLNQVPHDLKIGLISNAGADRGDLLHWVMMSLDQEFEGFSYVKLFQKFQSLLISEYALGRRTVLIFDEAQNLTPGELEELRMLSNINGDKDNLLQLILVGQPQLRKTLQDPDLLQFTQRISSDFHLRPLSADEVREYIAHRLSVAGAERQIFTDNASDLVFQTTGGVPRLINILCDKCLVYGFSEELPTIDEKIVWQVFEDKATYGIFPGQGLKQHSRQRA